MWTNCENLHDDIFINGIFCEISFPGAASLTAPITQKTEEKGMDIEKMC